MASSSCRVTTSPVGDVEATATTNGILVTNGTSQAISYVAFDRDALALALYAPAPCSDRCPTIAAGERRTIPWGAVVGQRNEQRVYYLRWAQQTTGGASGEVTIVVPDSITIWSVK